MSFISYIKERRLLLNLILIVLTLTIIIIASFYTINIYTHHGEAIAVPDFKGLTFEKAEELASQTNFKVEISDSVHFQDKEKGTIVSQVPLENSLVKSERTIYLIINGIGAETIAMPDLTGISIRQASADAEIFGLKIGKLTYVPDISTTVLRQMFNGNVIKPNTPIVRGSTIDLVVGKGSSNEKTFVPNIVGLYIYDADHKLSSMALNIGSVTCDKTIKSAKDSSKAIIWKQSPNFSQGREIKLGSYIDIWLTLDKNLVSESNNDNSELNDL